MVVLTRLQLERLRRMAEEGDVMVDKYDIGDHIQVSTMILGGFYVLRLLMVQRMYFQIRP